jgi:hypothetical protein
VIVVVPCPISGGQNVLLDFYDGRWTKLAIGKRWTMDVVFLGLSDSRFSCSEGLVTHNEQPTTCFSRFLRWTMDEACHRQALDDGRGFSRISVF